MFRGWTQYKNIVYKYNFCVVIHIVHSLPLVDTIIIVKLENETQKKKIMINKSILKGESAYIENELCWEDRKIQEKINK